MTGTEAALDTLERALYNHTAFGATSQADLTRAVRAVLALPLRPLTALQASRRRGALRWAATELQLFAGTDELRAEVNAACP